MGSKSFGQRVHLLNTYKVQGIVWRLAEKEIYRYLNG